MLYNLEEVFKNRIFRIPNYQRGYSWDKIHLEQLWNDISNIRYPHPPDSYHFTGILTLNKFNENDLDKLKNENHGYQITEDNKVRIKEQDYDAYQLVDGQQRMTSLLILISILIDAILAKENFDQDIKKRAQLSKNNYLVLIDNDGETKHLFGYETDVPSHQFLLNKIFDDNTIDFSEPETLYTNKLSFAKEFFLGKIVNSSEEEIKKLFHKIEERLLFSILDLNSDNREIDVSLAFETLNFRGKNLSNLELFKNRLLYLVSKTTFSEERKTDIKNNIIKTWLDVYKWIGANPNKELNDDDFLKAFWLLQFSNEGMVMTDFQSWSNSIFNNLFSLQVNPNDNEYLGQSIHSGIDTWLKLMRKAVELWFIIKNPYFFDENNDDINRVETRFILTDEIKLYLQKIEKLPLGGYMQNLVLAIFARHLQDEDYIEEEENEEHDTTFTTILKLLKAIERHNVACFLFNGNKTNYNREKIFRCVNYYFKTGNGVIKRTNDFEVVYLLDYINDLTTFNINNIASHVHKDERFLSWVGIHYLLWHWEMFLAQKENVKLNFEKIRTEKWQPVKLIYKPNQNANNFGNLNNRQIITRYKYAYSLGNLFLSKSTANYTTLDDLQKRIRNRMVDGSENVSFNERQILEYEEWNEDMILERGKEMLSFAFENWNLKPGHISNSTWKSILLDIVD